MNPDTIFQLLQQSFRVGVGFTAAILETLQDPQKRNKTLSELQQEIAQKIEEWAKKGEITEKEAREFVDQWLNSQSSPNSPQGYPSSTNTKANVNQEIQQLTEKIITLRQELEDLREKKKS
ncbi:unknown [Crocosphaera subtropica ATCC 51142]|uniref:Uncharacterized protein n=1 Tax=Crocosphaera subtropica (strain ATCC 51142 / BH68) TaxID=43989 RepID=B1WPA4_CROS5|nr:hypothetical protein [Crocosphaera subtropica]ACB49886.1 unknown [Crocosphaera subtropica ATCC 51142]